MKICCIAANAPVPWSGPARPITPQSGRGGAADLAGKTPASHPSNAWAFRSDRVVRKGSQNLSTNADPEGRK